MLIEKNFEEETNASDVVGTVEYPQTSEVEQDLLPSHEPQQSICQLPC